MRYRSPRVVRLGGWSPQLPAGFPVPRGTREPGQPAATPFAYGALTPSGRPSQVVRLRRARRSGRGSNPHQAPQPPDRNGCRLGTIRVWANAPFAHHYLGPHGCFLLLGVLRCFSSPGSPPYAMDSRTDDSASPEPGCPIRRSADHSLSTTPRGFSQSPASFIGPWRLGIPHALFSTRRPPTGAPSLQDRIRCL